MSAVTLQIPDDLDLALNVPPNEPPHALLVAAAVKLFELGKISAGKAAELAGMPTPLSWSSSRSGRLSEHTECGGHRQCLRRSSEGVRTPVPMGQH